MTQHRDHRTVSARFSFDPWALRQSHYDPADHARDESLFALGNGYVGLRASFEEGTPAGATSIPGTYLNGFHEREPIAYPEDAYGYARWRQTLLNVTSATGTDIRIDGVEVDPSGAGRFERTLDLRAGTLERSYVWTHPDGNRARIRFLRAISLEHRARAAFRTEIEPLDGEIRVELRRTVDGRVENRVETGDPRVGTALVGQVLQPVAHHVGADGRMAIRQRAPGSGMELICAADHRITIDGAPLGPAAVSTRAEPLWAEWQAAATVPAGRTLRVDAHVVYLDARELEREGVADEVDGSHGEALDVLAAAELDAYAADGGIDALLRSQRATLDAFWERADVEIEGDAAATQSVRFGLFHLLQGAGRDGRTNLPSKGLTGEGYEGHTFWDTEVYTLPVFLHVRPDIARALLADRVRLLGAARARASELHHDGALFPWRTIDGPEASAYFPAGTAQYHIDADIVLALKRYLEGTDDGSLAWEGGAAIAVEVARFFLSAGSWGRDGAFHLFTVTGPDEYTALIDDNHYTNRTMQASLRFAADLVASLRDEDPGRFATMAEELSLRADEPEAWSRAADGVHLPVDDALAVTSQDATFLDKPEWPWEHVPAERYPLLLHYHPLDIYRHQVLKQADVLLAHYLLPDGVSRSQLRRDEAYYAPRTTHDSSLSPCVHAIVAADLGRVDDALDHYRRTARMDLDDLNGNVRDGIHAAAMGGTWLATVEGFGGFRVRGGEPSFHPRLPDGWRRLRFRLGWRGRTIEVDADHASTRYQLLEGDPMTVRHRGEMLALEPGAPAVRPTGARLRGVAFDLDGVLTDSAEYHYLAWKALADELDVPFDREANEALRGVPRMESLEAILARGEGDWNEDEKRALAAKKNANYQRMIEQVTPRDLLPGIPELLAELRQAGIAIAIASSSRNAPTLIDRLGIADRIDVVVDPAGLRRGKPDPEIFETAAEALGLPVEDCVGVEDAPAGIEAIVGARMPAVGVGDAYLLAGAQVVVPDTSGLTLELLERAVREADTSG